jgi:methionyl-tRNA synthetase
MIKPNVTFEDFNRMDIRIGRVVEASVKEGSEKLLRFVVDFGSEIGQKVIFSGIRQWYTPEDFLNKKYPFVVNMAPKKMLDEESQGMLLLVDGERPVPIMPSEDVKEGDVVR